MEQNLTLPQNEIQALYFKALWFAEGAHRGQNVPGTEAPYLVHLSLVAMEVMVCLQAEPFHDAQLAVACALLHDTLEDTAVTIETLQEEFGEAVAFGVLSLTKNKTLPKSQQMVDSLQRIQKQPTSVWLVKLADRITNLSKPPQHWSQEKKEVYQQEATSIYETLHTASPFLAKRLEKRIEAYTQFIV